MRKIELDLYRWDYNKSAVLVNDSPNLDELAWEFASPARIISEIKQLIQFRNQMLDFIEDTADSHRGLLEDAQIIIDKNWDYIERNEK